MKQARLTKAGIFTPRTRARAADPSTSADAAAGLDVSQLQQRVLGLFMLAMWTCPDGGQRTTHDALISAYRQRFGADTRESTVRTRVAELVDLGLVENSGLKAQSETGAAVTIWQLTEKGRTRWQETQK